MWVAAHPFCPARLFYDPLKNRSGGRWESKRKGVLSSSNLFRRRRAFVTSYDPLSVKSFSPCYLSRVGKEEIIMPPAPSNKYRRISVFVAERGGWSAMPNILSLLQPPTFLFSLSHNDFQRWLFLIVLAPLHWKFSRLVGVFKPPLLPFWCQNPNSRVLDIYLEIYDVCFH